MIDIIKIINEGKVETPAHVIDLNQVYNNLENINAIRKETGIKVFFTLKGFSNDIILKRFINNLDGVSSSGLFESKLGRELNMKISTFSNAYTDKNIQEICKNSDYVIFNSINQYNNYKEYAKKENCSIGIRINPEYTELPNEFGANTCKKDSHLGIKKDSMPAISEFYKNNIEGIHLHTMCEQHADALERTIDNLIQNYDEYLKNIKWLNLGGGQLLGDKKYNVKKAIESIKKLQEKYNIDIILEPCEGIMFNSGYYVTRVVDLIKNNINIAVVDGSAICHIPDSVYKGWTKDMIGEVEDEKEGYKYKITGCSCYAGDTFGEYYLNKKLEIGDVIVFEDTASYTMVKNNIFNGISFPNLYVIDINKNLEKVKNYGYDIFKMII